jgi:transposase
MVDVKLGSRNELARAGVAKVDASGRRWYTARFKRDVVAQCLAPRASVSRVSIEHGLNTNLVRKWIRKAQSDDGMSQSPLLLPVAIEESGPSTGGCSNASVIEICVGGAVIRISDGATASQIAAVVRALR